MCKVRTLVLIALAAIPLGASGCFYYPLGVGTFAPFSMGLFTPIPIQPWVTERMEEKYCHKNDFRTPVMPPIQEGVPPPLCEDPPDDARVLRAMPKVVRGVPYFYEEFRDDIQIVKELIVDKIDPPRFFPLVGPARLHHCHWKCTIYYTETIESSYPFPFRCVKPAVEVVYIDLDHPHLYPHPGRNAEQAVFRDLSGY
jgi:hypothetical protein